MSARCAARRIVVLAALLPLLVPVARVDAEVTRAEITARSDVGSSGYEKIVGTLHFAVDPKNPRNLAIVDLDKAATGRAGRVEFSADLYILRPKDAARSNGVALFEVVNRGRKGLLNSFSRATGSGDPATEADLGDGFLTRQGFTLVSVGWEFDVRGPGLMRITAPPAAGVTGVVRAVFIPNDREPTQTVGDLAGYSPVDPDGPDTALTVRDGPFGRAEPIARTRWSLAGNVVTMSGGFEAGRHYELAYRATNPDIGGLGLAAFRDAAAWVKGAPDAVVSARHAIAFGSSQSGRFLRTFLYYGFNTDERGRQVFDGVMAHIAGAARLSLNERWAMPTGLGMFTATAFPFASSSTVNPVGGERDGLIDNDRARQNQPKVFFTNTAVEYWGGGRSAALLHTTPDGRADLAPPDNVRVYFLAGTQHGPSAFPPRITTGQQRPNPVNYWWAMRALLVAMDRWVREGVAPPASQVPRLADGTLVPVERVTFPSIPGAASPLIIPPARQGSTPLAFLVPQVDEDGNERAGIRLPDVAVPLSTYTGWNFRSPTIGGATELVALMGSSMPFPPSRDDRSVRHDPRRAIEERYASKEQYLGLVRAAAGQLVKDGYLLADDEGQIVKRAEDTWNWLHP